MGLKTAQSSSHHNGKDRCHGQPAFACGMHRAVILHLWTSSSRKIFYVCAPIYGPINLKDARTDAAISLNPPLPQKSSAIEFLRQRFAQPWTGCHLIYSTVAWQYFSKEEQKDIAELIATRGAASKSPLAWLRIEADGKSPGAGMRLDLWPEQKRIELGRMDFHGRWITWAAPQLGH